MTEELAGQRALVTGATTGIGRAIARSLAGAGAEVVVTGRRAERGAETVELIEADGGRATFVPADLGALDDVERLAREAGEIGILVNNAGFYPMVPTTALSAAEYQLMYDVNLRSAYFLTAAIAPRMVGGSAIVNVSSTGAQIGMPVAAGYSGTKAALESMTRSWAVEFGPAGIRVNAVCAGMIRTDKLLELMPEEGLAQVSVPWPWAAPAPRRRSRKWSSSSPPREPATSRAPYWSPTAAKPSPDPLTGRSAVNADAGRKPLIDVGHAGGLEGRSVGVVLNRSGTEAAGAPALGQARCWTV